MANKQRILLASRAVESPPQEGGFVLLRDIAETLVDDEQLSPVMLASSNKSYGSIQTEKVFSATGWNGRLRLEFFIGLFRVAPSYPIVHMAHIPTRSNVRLMKIAAARAKKRGTRFVQTITGLPAVSDKELKRLLWGDYIVCQSPSALARVRSVGGSNSSLIVPWPSPKRVAKNASRAQQTRKRYGIKKGPLVVFPGEFERMAIGTDFTECIDEFLGDFPEATIVLACRFDTLGIGSKLAESKPDNVRSVGKTNDIIELMEAADLVIFPTRKMDSKFHPPLIITEALTLGTKVVVSDLIDIKPDVSPLLFRSKPNASWQEFAHTMLDALNSSKPLGVTTKGFSLLQHSYRDIYKKLLEDTEQ